MAEETLSGEPARYAGGIHRLGDGVQAWLMPNGTWGQSNAALISGHNASLLVDTLWDLKLTRSMLDGFRPALGPAPIKTVVNTHHDGDHWFGNQLTGAAEILSTSAAARGMKRHGPGQMRSFQRASRLIRTLSYVPGPWQGDWRWVADYFDGILRPYNFTKIRPSLPTATFTGDLRLDVGGRLVELKEVGPAHTSGDLIVHLPEERILMAGDVLFLGVTPLLWDGSVRNWIKACERILELNVDTVLPGHGPVSTLAGVDAMRKYWMFVRAATRRHFDRGRSASSAARRIVWSDEFRESPFAKWDGQERIMVNVHSIYRRLMGQKGPVGALGRLSVMRQTALLAKQLQKA